MTHKRIVTIGADHPSVAGHFPGHPVVPGVVVLGEIMEAIRQKVRHTIIFVGMPTAKFLSPLIPGEPLAILLEQDTEHSMQFTCQTGSRLVVTGCLQYRHTSRSTDSL